METWESSFIYFVTQVILFVFWGKNVGIIINFWSRSRLTFRLMFGRGCYDKSPWNWTLECATFLWLHCSPCIMSSPWSWMVIVLHTFREISFIFIINSTKYVRSILLFLENAMSGIYIFHESKVTLIYNKLQCIIVVFSLFRASDFIPFLVW